jgi:uncharacterized membrane protein YccC
MLIGYLLGGSLPMLVWPEIGPWVLVGSVIGLLLMTLVLSVVRPYREWMKARTWRAYERKWAKQP